MYYLVMMVMEHVDTFLKKEIDYSTLEYTGIKYKKY